LKVEQVYYSQFEFRDPVYYTRSNGANMKTQVRTIRIPDGLWTHLMSAASTAEVSVSEVIRERCTPEWTQPRHSEIDLRTVEPEDLGLDGFDQTDSLVQAIYRAQEPA
jgi:hypothetical protein